MGWLSRLERLAGLLQEERKVVRKQYLFQCDSFTPIFALWQIILAHLDLSPDEVWCWMDEGDLVVEVEEELPT